MALAAAQRTAQPPRTPALHQVPNSCATSAMEPNKYNRATGMNTEIAVHPKLHHCGLTTSNLDEMIDWYRTMLGMTVNRQGAVLAPP